FGLITSHTDATPGGTGSGVSASTGRRLEPEPVVLRDPVVRDTLANVPGRHRRGAQAIVHRELATRPHGVDKVVVGHAALATTTLATGVVAGRVDGARVGDAVAEVDRRRRECATELVGRVYQAASDLAGVELEARRHRVGVGVGLRVGLVFAACRLLRA